MIEFVIKVALRHRPREFDEIFLMTVSSHDLQPVVLATRYKYMQDARRQDFQASSFVQLSVVSDRRHKHVSISTKLANQLHFSRS